MTEPRYLGNPFIMADPSKCLHCHNCELACAAAGAKTDLKAALLQGIPLVARNQVVKVDDLTMPVQCRQCEDAPCSRVCPMGAIRQAEGRVELIKDICIGCKTCMIVCPFGAIELIQARASKGSERREAVVADKCDLCFENLSQGKQPACLQACPTHSLVMVLPEKWRQAHLKQSARDLIKGLPARR